MGKKTYEKMQMKWPHELVSYGLMIEPCLWNDPKANTNSLGSASPLERLWSGFRVETVTICDPQYLKIMTTNQSNLEYLKHLSKANQLTHQKPWKCCPPKHVGCQSHPPWPSPRWSARIATTWRCPARWDRSAPSGRPRCAAAPETASGRRRWTARLGKAPGDGRKQLKLMKMLKSAEKNCWVIHWLVLLVEKLIDDVFFKRFWKA